MTRCWSLVFLACCTVTAAADPVPGLRVAPGFTVSQYSDPSLANDIYTLHIDARGRVVVAGRGYVRHLVGTEMANRAVDLVAGLNGGPMGILWEDDVLYVTAEKGLNRYRNVDGITPIKKSELVIALKATGEHEAHAFRRGPDGRLYLLCGNMAGLTKNQITDAESPIKDPIAGTLLRFNVDETVACIADGLRNPYDFDFATTGEPYTFDSDNERCVGLPWYEFCRFYKIVPGGNYGWRSPQFAETWRRPPYFFDIEAPVATLGRGSPTGVACYRHTQFPERFHGGFFLADWTFGKIWFVPIVGRVAGKPEVFLESVGENGFAPTGLAVHPITGDLYVSVGGRGTRGAVYRISTTTPKADAKPIPYTDGPAANRRAKTDSALDAVRQLQLDFGDLSAKSAHGTVWEGYTLRSVIPGELAGKYAAELRTQLPSGQADLDRELLRTLAALQDTDSATVTKAVGLLGPKVPVVEEVHVLICLGRLGGTRTPVATAKIADALVNLDAKYAAGGLTRDRWWPVRLGEATTALLKQDPGLSAAVVAHPAFGRAEHGWLARVTGIDRELAARRFVAAAAKDADFGWTPGLVELLLVLPDAEVRALLPTLARRGLDEAILPVLARQPVPADRPQLLAGLAAVSPDLVLTAVQGLNKLSEPLDDAEAVALILALRRLGEEKSAMKPNAKVNANAMAVTDRLRKSTGQDNGSTATAWEAWLAKANPTAAKKLAATTGFDATAWAARSVAIPWADGKAAAGKIAFTKATCAACHDGGSAVGPPLAGISKRFSRDDLLTAILDPNRDVSPRYRSSRIITLDGKVYDGVIIYDATDGLMLSTGSDTTVRIAGDRIESRKPLATSLMPGGLLEKLTDAEVADLMAYLRTL